MGKSGEWDVEEACSVMLGLDRASRLLVDQFVRRLAPLEFGRKVRPDTKGIAISCIMMSAYYCEVALKTLQASLTGGNRSTGHDLLALYDETRDAYEQGGHGDLERTIHDEMHAPHARTPADWRPPNIRAALEAGRSDFELWRYGLMEGKGDEMRAVPHKIYTVAAAVCAVVIRRHPSLWQ